MRDFDDLQNLLYIKKKKRTLALYRMIRFYSVSCTTETIIGGIDVYVWDTRFARNTITRQTEGILTSAYVLGRIAHALDASHMCACARVIALFVSYG